MRLPAIQGLIRRRILVSWNVDPEAVRRLLPAPLEPKLAHGRAIVGVCLIRLEEVRPRGLARFVGLSSENAAHRIAVTWEDERGAHEGVFIARRDTGSLLNSLAGGRVFPGEHRPATFDVRDEEGRIALDMSSSDGTAVRLRARAARALPATSVFASVAEASLFFEGGSSGYSVTGDSMRLDGLRLVTKGWCVEPLEVEAVSSSWISSAFPAGSVAFDHALVLRDLEHEWEALPDLAVRPR
jgi:hypothetical protein